MSRLVTRALASATAVKAPTDTGCLACQARLSRRTDLDNRPILGPTCLVLGVDSANQEVNSSSLGWTSRLQGRCDEIHGVTDQ
eukprot:469301-Prorocentrum_minimum.AAC.1